MPAPSTLVLTEDVLATDRVIRRGYPAAIIGVRRGTKGITLHVVAKNGAKETVSLRYGLAVEIAPRK